MMKKMDQILSEMYDSKDYNSKGYAVRNLESFLVQGQDGCYLALVMEKSNLDGTNPSYEYALYSLTHSTYIGQNTEQFKRATRGYPNLAKLDGDGGAADLLETLRLNEMFSQLVENAAGTGMLTRETIAQYRAYLKDMEKMKSPSVKKLYRYFSEAVSR